jgi:hypothetical protein
MSRQNHFCNESRPGEQNRQPNSFFTGAWLQPRDQVSEESQGNPKKLKPGRQNRSKDSVALDYFIPLK